MAVRRWCASTINTMSIDMNEAQLRALVQMRQFPQGARALNSLKAEGSRGRHGWSDSVLSAAGRFRAT